MKKAQHLPTIPEAITIYSGIVTSVSPEESKKPRKEREKTPQELEYLETVKNCQYKRRHLFPKHMKGAIYPITTIAQSDRYGGTRTPVVCSTFKQASKYVLNNAVDMWETTYDLVVIEPHTLDRFYSSGHKCFWYKWDRSQSRYRPIHTPEVYERVCRFGIG